MRRLDGHRGPDGGGDQFHDAQAARREAGEGGKNAERRDEHDGCSRKRQAYSPPCRPDHDQLSRDLKHDERKHFEQELRATHQFVPAGLESQERPKQSMLFKLTKPQSAQPCRPDETCSDGGQGQGTGDEDEALKPG